MSIAQIDSNVWVQLGETVANIIEFSPAFALVTVDGNVNCTTNKDGADFADSPLEIVVTPGIAGLVTYDVLAAGAGSITIEDKCWSITNVLIKNAANVTITEAEQQEQIKAVWTANFGALPTPSEVGITIGDFESNNFVVENGLNGVLFTVPSNILLGAVTQFKFIKYDGGAIDYSGGDISLLIVIPAKPTDCFGVIIDPTTIQWHWIDRATIPGFAGLIAIQVSTTTDFAAHTDFEADPAAPSSVRDTGLSGLDTTGIYYIRMRVHDNASNTDSGWTAAVKVDAVGGDSGPSKAVFANAFGFGFGF